MRDLDVVVISPYPPAVHPETLPTGAGSYMVRLAEALAREGVVLDVLAPRIEGEPDVLETGWFTVERPFDPGPMALPRAAWAARRSGARLAHLHYELFGFGGASSIPSLAPALAALRYGHLHPVVTMQQVVDPRTVDKGYTRINRVQAPPLVARAGISGVQRTVTALASATIVPEESLTKIMAGSISIPHGVERRDRLPSASAKATLGLPQDRFVVLCFGFIAPYKGFEVALEAAEIAGLPIQLVMAGGGHPRLTGQRDPYVADLRRRYDRVARFTGFVPDEDVSSWFSAADCVLVPYPRPFSSGGVLAIALGHGTPVLVSPAIAACSGAPEEMVTSLDPHALANRLLALAQDRRQLERLRSAVETMAEGRTWEASARRHIELYEQLLGASTQMGSVARSVPEPAGV